MLAALEGSITGKSHELRLSYPRLTMTGHESLYGKTGIIQSDISISNLMINKEERNPF